MAVNPALAAKAYANVANLSDPQSSGAGPINDPGQFAELVNTAVQNVADSGKKAEAVTAQIASGQADVVDLVTAVAETEVAVQTLVTVRDRVITAYQEILNMPI